ncbi:MAG: DUF3034 family protein [Pseudomonadales bacterium]
MKRILCLALLTLSSVAQADGKLIGTAGVSTIEGAGGGGIVPWALISGYATRDELGGAAFYSNLTVDDYAVNVAGVSVGFNNRLEVVYAHHDFEIKASDTHIVQNIFSVKYRVFGDAIFSSAPQLSIGIQHKRLQDSDVAFSVGAADDTGTDVYLAATKVWLDGVFHRTTLLNATARLTKANQTGILGFGGQSSNDYKLQLELAAGVFLTRKLAIGMEYRQKPDNLGLGEDDWQDFWIAYFISKRFSVTGAYVDLGSIAGVPGQNGMYLSVQLSL